MSCDPVIAPDEDVNPPLLNTVGLTTLVDDPDAVVVRTTSRDTDAVMALRRGLAEYLSQVSVNVAGEDVRFVKVYETWAEVTDQAEYPAAVVLIDGDAEYDEFNFTPTIDPNDKIPSGEYLVKYSEVTVKLLVEAHCTTPGSRTGVAMLLEDAMNPVDWMHGFRLDLPHYYGQRGTYQVLMADFHEDAEEARQEFRPMVLSVDARISQVRVRRLPLLSAKLDITTTEPSAGV